MWPNHVFSAFIESTNILTFSCWLINVSWKLKSSKDAGTKDATRLPSQILYWIFPFKDQWWSPNWQIWRHFLALISMDCTLVNDGKSSPGNLYPHCISLSWILFNQLTIPGCECVCVLFDHHSVFLMYAYLKWISSSFSILKPCPLVFSHYCVLVT